MQRFAIPTFVAAAVAAAFLGGCQSTQVQTSLAPVQQDELRAAAHHFTDAVRLTDAGRVQAFSVVDGDPQSRTLGEAVLSDTLAGRRVHQQLADRFGYVERDSVAVGSDAWLGQMESTIDNAPIQKAGDRARIGYMGEGNGVYLRQVAGEWKVEVIPTLVAEAGGRPTINDPLVDYRFGVTRAMNQWMLDRLSRDDFRSKADYDKAKNSFWMQYLTYATSGKDPKNELLSTLPPLPREDGPTAQEW
jgi:hypothetical protein